MGFDQVKRINNNISRPLNELMNGIWNRVDTRRYFYNDCVWDNNNRTYVNTNTTYTSTTYTIPISGYYTIRAYVGNYGSYGKVIGQFAKGERLGIYIGGANSISISSSRHSMSNFYISLTTGATVNAIGNGFISALAIGGASYYNMGGSARVRCNNGIAVGGGGGCSNPDASGGWIYGEDGGSAYAWGDNVYALGGGSGAHNSSVYNRPVGGNAYVNDKEVTTYCSYNNSNALQSGRGYQGNNYYGGNGGSGGGGSSGGSGGRGYYSYGGRFVGGSGKGGNNSGSFGYFAGASINGSNAGSGGFYGGSTWANYSGARGGNGKYGFGGDGNRGGDGQLKGGNGIYGGNGLKPGVGSSSNGNAIRHKSIIHTLPAWHKNGYSSIVILEYGISKDDY